MAATGLPVLWHIKISHFNEKARWALDFKGIAHERRAPQPGLHELRARQLTGGTTFPVLELDGRAIGDSTAIIAALEERFPHPPLYPADPDERRRALAIEDHFDEVVAPALRRLVFWHLLRAGGRYTQGIVSDSGPVRRAFARLTTPMARPLIERKYGIDAAQLDAARDQVRGGLERIEAERAGRDHLVGEAFTVADLTAAAILAPLVQPAEFPYPLLSYPEELERIRAPLLEHPGAEWVRETYRRERPPSAEVRTGTREPAAAPG